MSGTMSGDGWLEDLKIEPDDFDAFHVKLRVHMRDVWETYFQRSWREYPDGVSARVFYEKLKQVNHEPFHRYCFDEILKEHPREFARDINNRRLEISDRRIFLKIAAVGIGTILGAKYVGKLFPDFSVPVQPEFSEEEKERLDRERLASLYASFLICHPQDKRIAVTDSIDKIAKYTDTLERRLDYFEPEMLRDKKECYRTAETLCKYRAFVGEEMDSIMKNLNIRQIRRGYIVTYRQPTNMLIIAGVAAKLQKLPPQNAADVKRIVQDYSTEVHAVRDEYESVKGVVRAEHISYEDSQKFKPLGAGIWGLVKKYEKFKGDLAEALKPSPIVFAEK